MPPSDQYRGNESILVVDDERLVLNFARSILRHRGYQVSISEIPRKRSPNLPLPVDLVLADIVMPKINGPELVKELKASHPDMPCIFMSGYDLNQMKECGVDSGCDYIRKPFTAEMLLKRVRTTLEEKTN